MKKSWVILCCMAFFGYIPNAWGAERRNVEEEWSQVKAELETFRRELKFPSTGQKYPVVTVLPIATHEDMVVVARQVWKPYMQRTAELFLSPYFQQLLAVSLQNAELWECRVYQALAKNGKRAENAERVQYTANSHVIDDLADFLDYIFLQAYLLQIGHNAPQAVVTDIQTILAALENLLFPQLIEEEDDGLDISFHA